MTWRGGMTNFVQEACRRGLPLCQQQLVILQFMKKSRTLGNAGIDGDFLFRDQYTICTI